MSGDAEEGASGQRRRRGLDRAVFATRWIMAPIYLGLLAPLCLVAVKFLQKLIDAAPKVLALSGEQTILLVLTLVDLSLVGNLVVIVMFAGWQQFLGGSLGHDQAGHDQAGHDRAGNAHWLVGLDFSAVKMKVIASIIAIASIQMLETFTHIDEVDKSDALWQLAILLGIGATGVMVALMDRLGGDHGAHPPAEP